ncbi:MAG: hypothetical protein KC416_17595 [Myxococcales bacterium]|nr:hypothetical protein [Myxococcales bacterium]
MKYTTQPRWSRASIIGVALATVVLTFFPAGETAAQGPTYDITVNPVDLVNGQFNFEFEGAVSPFASLHAGVNFLVWDGVFTDDSGDTFTIGPEVGFRLFPFMGAPEGLWLGPYAGLAYVHASRGGSDATGMGYYFGGMVGATLILFDFLVGSVGAGLGHADLSKVVNGTEVGPNGLTPRFRLAVGFAF